MSHDSILTVGKSTVQMGAYNDRIYLMSLAAEDGPEIVDELISMAVTEDLSKIFAKVPKSQVLPFLSCGFEKEAQVPGMFSSDDGVFLSFYRYMWRKEQSDRQELDRVISVAESKKGKGNSSTLSSSLLMRRLGTEDAHALAQLYGQTFKTYPFPITDPDFICQEMRDGVRFMGVYKGDSLVGAASAEVAADGNSAEMTDFAVNPDYRKAGIAGTLLRSLEDDCSKSGIKCFFTIARACSYGINSLFSKGDYEFSGRLLNNTNISGSLESMNVWYKVL
ncbi:putative beta-lysine N-acetyltransferase [Desulfovibrio sp. JC022]|uniref:putative beta-lysine N-acetyltransferase n=1 Tax=Desulfovibrio sp. JC022 TaxID=2593642 RepID=UPI0013D643A1|nr:putative beta-lysine N-acetyltransferase [Desulfovibrio sp. JC022]NDV23820.1 putative beta-lysine N-acetyltransferase [Desulfovibrio sp. JC022]